MAFEACLFSLHLNLRVTLELGPSIVFRKYFLSLLSRSTFSREKLELMETIIFLPYVYGSSVTAWDCFLILLLFHAALCSDYTLSFTWKRKFHLDKHNKLAFQEDHEKSLPF